MAQREPHQTCQVVLSPAIVMERVGMDEAGILVSVNAGTFPKPIKFDGRVVWKDQDIQKWIAQRVAAGDKKTGALNRRSPAIGQLIDFLAAEDAKDYLAEQRAEDRLRKP